MTAKTRPRSRILAPVHATARDLRSAGFIDKRRMREYAALCLASVRPYSSRKIRALRARAVRAMEATDIASARDYFAGKAKEQLGAARDAGETPAASAGVDR